MLTLPRERTNSKYKALRQERRTESLCQEHPESVRRRREGWRQKWDLEKQGLHSQGEGFALCGHIASQFLLVRVPLAAWEPVRLPLWGSRHAQMVLWSEVGRSGRTRDTGVKFSHSLDSFYMWKNRFRSLVISHHSCITADRMHPQIWLFSKSMFFLAILDLSLEPTNSVYCMNMCITFYLHLRMFGVFLVSQTFYVGKSLRS